MRIGIDVRLWNETGVGRYIRNLVWQLEKIDKKNEYVLFTYSGINRSELNIQSNRFKIVETNIHWHTIEEQTQLPKILEKENLNLVHFPYFSVPILYKKPFVITIHDLIINHYPTGKASTLPLPVYYLKHFGYQFVMKQAAKKAQKILTVSEATKSEIVEHLNVSADKITVTYEGVDKKLTANNGQGTKGKEKYFLYVGNAYPHKNLERLIEVFEKIIKEKPQCKLLLVGKEDYFYTRLKEKVLSKHLEDSIVFCRNVSDEELMRLYAGATALITPSLMEGFGLPGLEAMHHGTLVLASDIPVYKEVYQDAAIYFDPLDVVAMHATILKVLDNGETFTKHIAKGYQLAKNFSWEKMAKETLKVYESSIGI
jgi:glycosyltransferase involved in cell wall biosynthesis